MSDSKKCDGLFGRLFGHRYEAQYDVRPPRECNFEKGSALAMVQVIDALSAKTYQGSVCRRCGDRVVKQG